MSGNKNSVKLPIISIVLMLVFLLCGTLVLFIDWPEGPAGLDWGIWLFGYGGYLFIIAAAIFHARTGR